MNKDNVDHSLLISHVLNIFPPSLREAVISDLKFCQSHGITADAQVSFGGTKASFSRSTLFKAIREAFSSSLTSIVKDRDAVEWSISILPDDKSVICIERHDEKLRSNVFWPLINDIKLRISIFQKEAERRNLSEVDIEKWLSVLSNEQLSDDEVTDLNADLESTPSYIEEQLISELGVGNNKIKTLIPDNIHYYERFIGIHTSSVDINKYSINELRQHFSSRVKKGANYLDLLLCSQQSISQIVAENISNGEEFISLAKEAIKSQNPISIIGCIEIGILNYLELDESVLKELFECLCAPKMMKYLTLLCSMTIIIDGELARLKIFKNKPPFYRRLASLTQASLVTKISFEQGIKFKDIEKWAMEERGMFFYCQNFIDLREEPRWLPGYLNPEQLRDELFGRIHIVCEKVEGSEFCKRILQELTSKSLIHLNSFLSGPLEGNTESAEIPDIISKSLDESMSDQASLKAFMALINSAQYWKVDGKYIDHVVTLLENAQHQLKETDDKESIYQTLNGLAKVSGLVRSKKLAASVMILSRIYRDYLNVNAKPENIMAVGLVASSAYEDKNEWAEYIGQWLNELAYLPLEVGAVSSLRSMLEQLCILEPYLYYTCGRPLEVLSYLERG